MSPPQPQYSSPRTATRAPVGRPVKLHFDDSTVVEEGTCRDISIGGMFVASEATREQGTLVRFEISLDDEASVRGLGEVIWRREATTGSRRDAGMGIKFRFLEQQDRQLILKIVSQHIKERLANRQSASAYQAASEPPAPVQAITATTATAGTAATAPTPPAPRSPAPASPATPSSGSRPAAVMPSPAAQAGPAALADDDPDTAELEIELDEPGSIDGDEERSPGAHRDAAAGVATAAAGRSPVTEPVDEPTSDDGDGEHLAAASAGAAAHSWTTPPAPSMPEPRSTLGDPFIPPPRPPLHRPRRSSRGLGVAALVVAVVAALLFVFWEDLGLPAGDDGAVAPPAVDAAVDPAPVTEPTPTTTPPAAVPPASLEEIEPASSPAVPADEPTEDAAEVAEPVTEPPPAADTIAALTAVPEDDGASPSGLTRLVEITSTALADGERITILADGPIPPGRVSRFRLDGESPREVVRIGGISRRFDRETLELGGPAVRQVRTGLHRRAGGDEIHVVLDLAAPGYRVTDVRTVGSRIEIDLGAG